MDLFCYFVLKDVSAPEVIIFCSIELSNTEDKKTMRNGPLVTQGGTVEKNGGHRVGDGSEEYKERRKFSSYSSYFIAWR
jgi:hypothetical protein